MGNNISPKRDEIAKRLKDARILAGLSQEQTADKIGLQRPAISDIESGKRKVSAEELTQFAELYKVDPAWILNSEESRSQNFQFAARELEKLNEEDIKRVIEIVKMLPNK